MGIMIMKKLKNGQNVKFHPRYTTIKLQYSCVKFYVSRQEIQIMKKSLSDKR
jgi:hypothetical protein